MAASYIEQAPESSLGSGKSTRLDFVGEVLAALTFAPAFAHPAEMPNKMGLDGPAWYTTQLIYRDWGAFLGPLETATLFVTAWLCWRSRDLQHVFTLTAVALGCCVAMQVCFWAFNFPVNLAVARWDSATLPSDWADYRARWEWGHAIRAVLAFGGLVCLLRSALVRVELTAVALRGRERKA